MYFTVKIQVASDKDERCPSNLPDSYVSPHLALHFKEAWNVANNSMLQMLLGLWAGQAPYLCSGPLNWLFWVPQCIPLTGQLLLETALPVGSKQAYFYLEEPPILPSFWFYTQFKAGLSHVQKCQMLGCLIILLRSLSRWNQLFHICRPKKWSEWTQLLNWAILRLGMNKDRCEYGNLLYLSSQ